MAAGSLRYPQRHLWQRTLDGARAPFSYILRLCCILLSETISKYEHILCNYRTLLILSPTERTNRNHQP